MQPRHPLVLASIFFVILVTYGTLLQTHYALDTYVTVVYGNQIQQHINLGRFLSAGIWKIFSVFNVNTASSQNILTFISICLLSISIYLLVCIFEIFGKRQQKQSLLFISLACLISLSNVFILHWFLFPEVVVFMMTGLLLSVLALYSIRDKDETISQWFLCFILLLAGFSFYQAVGAIFVTFGLLYYALKKEQSLRAMLKGFIKVFATFVLAGIINISFIKLYSISGSRTGFERVNPLRNIAGIVDSLAVKLQNTNLGIIPVIVFFLVMCFLVIFFGYFLWKSSNRSRLLFSFLPPVILIIGSFLATMAPHLITSTVDISPRSIVALMSLPGVVSLYIFLRFRLVEKPLFFYLLLGFVSLFLVVNVFISHRVELSRLATNRMDREIAEKINQKILQYEVKTGQIVTRIAFRHDEMPTLCYPGLICYGNFRAMGRDWTIVPLMSMVSGRQFSQASMPEEIYDTIFKFKNWDNFDKEQIAMSGDTLYLILF